MCTCAIITPRGDNPLGGSKIPDRQQPRPEPVRRSTDDEHHVRSHPDDSTGPRPSQPAADGSGLVLVSAVPTVDPSDPDLGATVDRLRADLPSSAQVGGAAVEDLDLKTQLDASTPIVVTGS